MTQQFHSKECKNVHPKYIYAYNVHLVLFIIVNSWKEPKFFIYSPVIDEWIKHFWYVCPMEYYSMLKKDEILLFL